MGQVVALGATYQIVSTSQHREYSDAFLVDLHCRFNFLLIKMREHGWHELEDQYAYACTNLHSEWQAMARCIEMVKQVVQVL